MSNQIFGWKDSNLGQRGRESVREKERYREICQIKLFSVERHQSGIERKGDREKEKERYKEIRQIKLFGVQRPIWD